jgi:hypothetical protein
MIGLAISDALAGFERAVISPTIAISKSRLRAVSSGRLQNEQFTNSSERKKPDHYRNEKIGGETEEESYDNPRGTPVNPRIQPGPYFQK